MIGFRETNLDQLAVDHQLEVNELTGTARLSVPIRVSPGRESFQPAMALGYGGGRGNSTFGAGWTLSGIPSIGLDTTKGLASYRGDEDAYLYSGSQQLVPMLRERGGVWAPVADNRGAHRVQRFRSTIERSFERFERWAHQASGRVHWVVYARNGVVSVFGLAADNSTRIADPADPDQRTFQWLLEAQYHPKGSAIVYEYKAEDGAALDPSASFEAARARRGGGFAQRYLKRIRYANSRPLSFAQPIDAANEWRLEVVFDYGEHGAGPVAQYSDAAPAPAWTVRSDPFSSRRPGFEVRTYRLCRRILMFHRFPELDGGAPSLVGATELSHRPDPAGTVLERIIYRGFRKNADRSISHRAVPALELSYSAPVMGTAFEVATATDNIPSGLDGAAYQWMDVRSEGLPGVLCRHNGGWYFKENLGGGRFGPMNPVAEVPKSVSAAFQLRDFDSDGNLNLVGFEGREAGYYQRDRDRGRWESFRNFHGLPRIDFANARVQWVDLNGDGYTDLIVERSDRISWYPSEGPDGFAAAVEIAKPDVQQGGAPTLTQNAALQTFFSDMTGDGLLDMVRVDAGRVEYWPNLGHGQFGHGVVMEDPPTLDDFGEVDARRLRLVDLDGSGTADLLYIGRGEIRFWINLSGNRFGAEQRIANLPYIDRLASAQVFDFRGDGTRCLVWSTPLPSHEGQAIQFLPLLGDLPPRLLVSATNGVGHEWALSYRSSAQDYLRDKAGDRPWRTLLPRHSMVVHQLDEIDRVNGGRFTTRYEYRDGYFDDTERRIVGFGLVDAFDSNVLVASGRAAPEEVTPPTLSRSWFHTGDDAPQRSSDFYARDPLAARPPAPEVEDLGQLTTDEQLEAFRALAGTQWRQEVYAIRPDGSRALHPYRTAEFGYRVRRLQPSAEQRDAAFRFEQSESITHEYEQDPSDPRVRHDVLLETDAFGNVRSLASVAYPRRAIGPEVRAEQQVLHIELTRREHENLDQAPRFELGIEVEERRFDLTGLLPAGGQVFSRADLLGQVAAAVADPLVFHDPPDNARPRARLIGFRRNRFWNDDRSAASALGQVGAVTLLHHVERAVFPDASVASLYDGRVTPAMLAADGRYRADAGFWWADDATYRYLDAANFFRLEEETSAGGSRQTYTFDPHRLLVTAIEDVYANRIEGTPDYQVLASSQVKDANDNLSEVLYDPLGVTIATSIHGTQEGQDGNPHLIGDDDVSTYVPVPGATTADVLNDPAGLLQGVTRAFFYDLGTFARGEGPPRSIHLEREQHRNDGDGAAPGAATIRTNIAYVDGFGRSIQRKVRVDAGPAIQRAGGAVVVDGDGRPILADAAERWLSSGNDVFNNKGWVVRRYEPFFSTTPDFESDQALREYGVATRTEYDPVGKIVREDLPNGSFSASEFRAWSTRQADPNDNVVGSDYEAQRIGLGPANVQRQALDKARAHANTPTIIEQDPLQRPVRVREIGTGGAERTTRTVFGPQGLPVRVIDPRGLSAFTYLHDMLGRSTIERGIDSGTRVTLLDTQGHPMHQWDDRGVHAQYRYDRNGRHTETSIDGAVDFDGTLVRNNTVERVVYGDNPAQPGAKLKNLRGRVARQMDDAGVVLFDRYHFDGQPIDVRRSLRSVYKGTVDWTDPALVGVSGAENQTQLRLDALGRVVEQRLRDGTTREYGYARQGHVSGVRVSTADGAFDRRVIASDIQFNARSQRTELVAGNGVRTSHEYDPETFQLQRLYCRRELGRPRDYLDVAYAYDPAGNVIRWVDSIQDPGAPAPLITGLTVSSACDFTYDAFYQLTEATGRVHQALLPYDYRSGRDGNNPIKGTRHLSLNNGAAIERYTRNYDYDLAGNIQRTRHRGATRNWTTEVWTSATSNRSLQRQDLAGVDIPNPETYFDANGNTIRLPHLREMNWNYANRLSRAVVIDRSGTGQPDDAEYYVYGVDGIRVRRVSEKLVAGQLEVTETTYFEGCEVRRITRGGNTRLLRYTSHIKNGSTPLATLHQWSIDQSALETDDIGRKNLHYLVGNHLGSVSLELSEDGEVISYEEYFPFGGTSFVAGDRAREVKLKEYRYSGKCRDDATGLYCYEYRYYAPFIGNWLSPDPLGPADGLNLYLFVFNNPIRFVDPDGLAVARNDRPPDLDAAQPGTGAGRSEEAPPPPPPAEPPPTPPPRPRRPRERRDRGGGGPAPAPSGGESPSPSPPPSGEQPDTPPPPVNPPSEADADGAEPPTPEPPSIGVDEESENTGPTYSDCERVWIEAGYRTDWEVLIREGREVQVWQEGHWETHGPCRERSVPDLTGDDGGTGDGEGTGPGEEPGGTEAAEADGGEAGQESGPGGEGPPTPAEGGEQTTDDPSAPPRRTGEANGSNDSSDDRGAGSTSDEVDQLSHGPAQGDQRSVPGDEQGPNGSGEGGSGTDTSGRTGEGAPPGEDYEGPVGLAYDPDSEDDRDIPWDQVELGLIDWLSFAPAILDAVQIVLDVVGLIPGFGEVADGINGLISLARGDNLGASLSFAAMIPFAGWLATGGKFTRWAVRLGDLISDVWGVVARYGDEVASALSAIARNSDEALQFASRNADELGGVAPQITRPAAGTTGSVDIASDFVPDGRRIGHSPLAPDFHSVPNGSGGRVWVSTKPVSQGDLAPLVNTSNAGGPVEVLTGTHGTVDGTFLPETAFFNQDLAAWGGTPGVTVRDITTMTPAQIQTVVESNARVVCAWCYSERSIAVLKGLGLIP